MARMRRIQIVIDPGLDDRLEQEAAARGMSKSALVRDCVQRGLGQDPENGLRWIGELAAESRQIEPVGDIDEYLYGPLGKDA
jgi:Ribbon-helix-helix protein, copG family